MVEIHVDIITFQVSLECLANVLAPLLGLLCTVVLVGQSLFEHLTHHLVHLRGTKPACSHQRMVTMGYQTTKDEKQNKSQL